MEKDYVITIIPAIYVGKREDDNIILKCLQGEETVNRAFESKLFIDIENPKYVLVGIMTGGNVMGINICDGGEFEKEYNENWNILLK